MSSFLPGFTEFSVGCNYWASHAGISMWHQWDLAEVEKDFAAMKDAGMNTVRLFPLWSDFQPVQFAYGQRGIPAEFVFADGSALPAKGLGHYGLSEVMIQRFRQVADLESVPTGAYSIRADGETFGKQSSENIIIEKKTDKPGIDIYIKAAGKRESVHIPVILAESGLKEVVYNDFHIEDGADVLIIAGCGIHNCGVQDSEHSGIHSFYLGKNAKVKYVEKHYGDGDGNGKNIMNPHTVVELAEGAYMEMETTQIKGVDSTKRKTEAVLHEKSTLIVYEKIMTHGEQFAETEFVVDLKGEDCGTHVVSRSVAKDNSRQLFISDVVGNAKCSGHTECDAIIMDNASVVAIPKIVANNTEASLIHEAAIGKIAGEQLIKLMTLGLDEKQAEEEIINGFLK